MSELREERKGLVDEEYNTYSPEHFPGSKAWNRNRAARMAVTAFDSAHPEVIAEIRARQAEKAAAEKAYWDSPEGREKMLGM